MKSLLLIIITTALVNNVVLSQFLGICSFLGVSRYIKTSFSLGAAVIFVITVASAVANLLYTFVLTPLNLDYLKTIVFILVIAALVQMVEMFTKKTSPPLYKALGIYLPLITVNCIVLGRAEAFASKNGPFLSLLDGIGMGIGFTLILTLLGAVREFIASGTLFELAVVPNWQGFTLLKFAPGAFLVLGVFMAIFNGMKIRAAKKAGTRYEPPAELNCATCHICHIGK